MGYWPGNWPGCQSSQNNYFWACHMCKANNSIREMCWNSDYWQHSLNYTYSHPMYKIILYSRFVNYTGSRFLSGPNSKCWFWPLKPSTAQDQGRWRTTCHLELFYRCLCHWSSRLILSRTFLVLAPWLWNVLPKQTHQAPNLLLFQCQAKAFIVSQASNPCWFVLSWLRSYILTMLLQICCFYSKACFCCCLVV